MASPVRPACPHCGTPNDPDAIYCGACGHQLGEVPENSDQSRQEVIDEPSGPSIKETSLGLPAFKSGEGTASPEKETSLGLPAFKSGEGTAPPEKAGTPPKKATSPGFLDPREAYKPKPPESPRSGELKARAILGGPTLLDEPSFPEEELEAYGASKDQGKQISPPPPSEPAPKPSKAAVTPTLMSEASFKVTPPLQQQGPSQSPQIESQSPIGGLTLLDQPVFGDLEELPEESASVVSGPQSAPPPQEPVSVDNPPPLSDEAIALLERFSGGLGMLSKPTEEEEESKSSEVHKPPDEEERSNTLKGLPKITSSEDGAPRAQDSEKPDSVIPTPPPSVGSTILGLPVPEEVRKSTPATGEGTPGEQAKQLNVGETMLGIPAPSLVAAAHVKIDTASSAGAGATSGAEVSSSDEGGMTMLGVPAPARRGDQPPDEEPPSEVASTHAMEFDSDISEIEPPRGLGRGWIVFLAILAVVVIVGVGVAVVELLFLRDAHDIRSEVIVGGDQLRVTLVVDPHVEGGRIRFAGQEQPLVDGRAVFELQSDLLGVGQNELPVEIEDPESGTSTTSVIFNVSYQAVADLGGLKASPPYYTVRFQVMKGATLQLASENVQLDDTGRYHHKILLSEALAGAMDAGDAVSHSVPFTVHLPEKAPAKQSIDTAIPRTSLKVLTPTEGLAVTSDAILCTGQTEPQAEVTINGAKVTAQKGRFSHSVPLAKIGEHQIEVKAISPGRAPRTVSLKVRRASDLAPLVQAFAETVDSSLDYERVNRDPESLRDRPVRFHGRVVALESSTGQTLMQVLVDEGCAQEGRCSIHVTYRSAVGARLFSWVTVYGTVAGRWEGQTHGGSRLVMPAILARFIIPDQGRR